MSFEKLPLSEACEAELFVKFEWRGKYEVHVMSKEFTCNINSNASWKWCQIHFLPIADWQKLGQTHIFQEASLIIDRTVLWPFRAHFSSHIALRWGEINFHFAVDYMLSFVLNYTHSVINALFRKHENRTWSDCGGWHEFISRADSCTSSVWTSLEAESD